MRLLIAVILALVLVAAYAHPHGGHHHDHKHKDGKKCPHGDNGNGDNGNGNGDNGNGNGENGNGNYTEPTEAVYGMEVPAMRPFPHFEDFVIYPVPGKGMLLPGSAFVAVIDQQVPTTCYRIQLTDEFGGACPLNQTICDIIASTPCEPAVANATCYDLLKPAGPLPTNIPEAEFGNGYPYGGPLCHVEVNGFKVQPSAYTSLNYLRPEMQMCLFDVAPAPTTTAEPVLAADPPCPFVEA